MDLSIEKKEPLVRVAFRLDPHLEQRVESIAREKGITISDVYRHIVRYFFSSDCKQNGDKKENETEQLNEHF